MKKRDMTLDLLKIIASWFVIYQHVGGPVLEAPEYSVRYMAVLALNIFTETSVPLFLMVSGALLLRKQESAGAVAKRILRIVFLIIVFSAFYDIFYYRGQWLDKWGEDILYSVATTAMWYLYLYIGFLFMLPILRKIQLTDRECLYLVGIVVLFNGIFPFIQYYFDINMPSSIIGTFFFPTYIVLVFLGEYVLCRMKREWFHLKGAIAAMLAIVVLLAFSMYCAVYQFDHSGVIAFDYLYNRQYYGPVILMAAAIAYLVKFLADLLNKYEWIRKPVSWIGISTFGIYLMGDFFRILYQPYTWRFLDRYNEFIVLVIYTSVTWFSAFVVSFLYQGMKQLANYVWSWRKK